jgi:hypothetical protein
VQCHRAVLGAASPALARRLEGPLVRAKDGEWVRLEGREGDTLVLGQVRTKDFRRLLSLLYNGYADVGGGQNGDALATTAGLKDVWRHLDRSRWR